MPTDLSAASRDTDTTTRLQFMAVAALIGVVAALIFVGWPDLDLAVSRLLYVEPRHFVFNHSTLAATLRYGFRLLTWAASIAAVSGIILALARNRRLFGLGLAQWTFLALVLITGPGLIANTLLKDNWARPRPLHIVEFGGSNQFKSALERSGACERNCSFISGEASSIFAIGFAIAMLARRRRAALIAATVAAGSIIGLIRMGEGGHFLSDVVFAGVFMALDVALVHWLVFDVVSPRVAGEAWWHAKTVAAAAEIRRQTEIAFAKSTDWLRRQIQAASAALSQVKERHKQSRTELDEPPV